MMKSTTENITSKIWGLTQDSIKKTYGESYDKENNELFIEGHYYSPKFDCGRVVDVDDL